MRRRPALIAVAAALALPASARADSYFTLDHPVRDIDVRANHVAWTVADSRGRAHLRGGFARTAHPLPVRPAASFGGIDLGTDTRGRTVLVYARCPNARRRPCDLYLYRPTIRRERRLASVSRRACSETKPHISRGVLLFTRSGRCSHGLFLKRPGGRLRRVMRRAPIAYDFAGRTVAFERSGKEIRLLHVGRRRSRVVALGEGGNVGGPRLDRGFVYWQRSVAGRDDILRRPLAGGGTETLERGGRGWVGVSSDNLEAFAVNRRRLFYLFGGFDGGAGFPIGLVEPAPVFR
jgi:hypothetical protein